MTLSSKDQDEAPFQQGSRHRLSTNLLIFKFSNDHRERAADLVLERKAFNKHPVEVIEQTLASAISCVERTTDHHQVVGAFGIAL